MKLIVSILQLDRNRPDFAAAFGVAGIVDVHELALYHGRRIDNLLYDDATKLLFVQREEAVTILQRQSKRMSTFRSLISKLPSHFLL